MKPFRPMLACKCEDIDQLRFPLGATPKIDGIRCVTVASSLILPNGQSRITAVSRSLKPIANRFVQNTLQSYDLPGLDGELVVIENESMTNFQSTTSGIMSESGQPNFIFSVFDIVPVNAPNMSYLDRMEHLNALKLDEDFPRIKTLLPMLVRNKDELLELEELYLSQGYEGVMLRSLVGPYKFGRSTWREHYLIKIKRFVDDEAVVIGFVEKMINDNIPTINNLGLQERSTHKDNLIPADTLGAVTVRNSDGVEFNVGSGFNDLERQFIWKCRGQYLGKILRYKYQPHGVKIAPRCPIYTGFRDPSDMDPPSFGKSKQTELF